VSLFVHASPAQKSFRIEEFDPAGQSISEAAGEFGVHLGLCPAPGLVIRAFRVVNPTRIPAQGTTRAPPGNSSLPSRRTYHEPGVQQCNTRTELDLLE
jgi:hypothetical protein